MCHLFLNLIVKILLIFVDFDEVTDRNKSAPFLVAHDVRIEIC